MSSPLFRKKTIHSVQSELADRHNSSKLTRTLKVRDLTMLGIAAVIGAGIFSTIGKAAFLGGPGVVFLFIITAITCGFTALCYAEFAARVPVSGSAYTYSYVAFGELIAWVIGWSLILEYAIGNIVVAISWSSYFQNLLNVFDIHIPAWMLSDYKTAALSYTAQLDNVGTAAWISAPEILGKKMIINIPAFLIVVFITWLAYIGIRESKKSANAMVVFKIAVLLVVIVFGLFYIQSDNYDPFLPNGFGGVLAGVSSVFYAYIGFDAISTTAEECEHPQRDLPRSMLYALISCTIIYIAVALVLTGIMNYSEFEHVNDPLAHVFNQVAPWMNKLISFSAIVATTGVLLVFQIGQPRIWMSMSRDGLLPKKFSKVHKKYHTPAFATIITGVLVAIPSLVINPDIVTDLTSIGTLFAFIIVCGGVLTLPPAEKSQKYKIPYISSRYVLPVLLLVFYIAFKEEIVTNWQNLYVAGFRETLFNLFIAATLIISTIAVLKKWNIIPILGLLCCLFLMIEIPQQSWIVFLIWLMLGLVFYFLYGYRKSKLARKNNDNEITIE